MVASPRGVAARQPDYESRHRGPLFPSFSFRSAVEHDLPTSLQVLRVCGHRNLRFRRTRFRAGPLLL